MILSDTGSFKRINIILRYKKKFSSFVQLGIGKDQRKEAQSFTIFPRIRRQRLTRCGATMSILGVHSTSTFDQSPQLNNTSTSIQAVEPQAPYVQTQGLSLVMSLVQVALGAAFALFLLALVPVLQAAREVLLEVAELVATIREEVPDTAAAIRLPALEITDTVEEVGALSSELTDGVRASARAVTAAGSLTTSGVHYIQETVVHEIVPGARKIGKRAGRRAAEVMAGAIEHNARLDDYSEPVITCAAETTRQAVSRVRKAAIGAKAARAIGGIVRNFRRVEGSR